MTTIYPIYKERNIPIVLACDNNYVPYLAVTLTSIVENANDTNNYDIIILSRNISLYNQERIQLYVKELQNFSVRFIDVNSYIEGLDFQVSKIYSIEIYFRLLMPQLLNEYTKAIYLDCDLVLTRDVAELLEIDIKNNYLGAVRDVGMILHFYTSGKKYIPVEYFEDNLEGIPPEDYFNTGVLIMNLERFRKDMSFEQLAVKINSNKWHFPDQDVLNILCNKNIYYLDMAWNTVPETPGNRTLENIIADLPKEISEEYIAARENPNIIHFALHQKPWKYTILLDYPMFDYFWKYAVKSPYCEDIILIKNKTSTVSEMGYILNRYLDENVETVKDERDIHYLSQSYYLKRFSQIYLKYEYAKLTSKGIEIEGYSIFHNDEAQNIEFYLQVNDEYILCQKFDRNIDEDFLGTHQSKAISFRAYLPFNHEEIYNIRIVCKIGEVYLEKNRVNFGQFFPIDKIYKGQYYYKDGYKMFLKGNSIVIIKCSKKHLFKSELNYLKSLFKSKEARKRKAVITRSVYWISKIMKHKPIWLIADNFLGTDNGTVFFNYLKNNQNEITPYFVTSKKSPAYEKMQSEKNVIYYESKWYKLLLLISSFSISSVTDRRLTKPFEIRNDSYRDILQKRGFIFLQHGVITQDLAREHNKYCYNPAGFVTSALPEHKSLLQGKYFYQEKDVWLTGLPRFDLLQDDNKKYITIMPTWRAYLLRINEKGERETVESYLESTYFKFYDALLNNEKLKTYAQNYGYTICYRAHPLMQNATEYFLHESTSDIKILDGSYQEMFANSSIIISDYSSAIFDFLYLRKPIIYAHFDREEFFSGKHVYDKGYLDYEKDGFGEVEYDLEGTVNRIIEYMENDCKLKEEYRERIDNFFAFNDQNNCKRVFEKIRELEKENK